jgi:hypothetical protein
VSNTITATLQLTAAALMTAVLPLMLLPLLPHTHKHTHKHTNTPHTLQIPARASTAEVQITSISQYKLVVSDLHVELCVEICSQRQLTRLLSALLLPFMLRH